MLFDGYIISLALGLLVGLILALTGAGGSILAVPLLAFSLNLSMVQAAPIGLIAVMLAATLGAVQGLRAGIVRYKAATLIVCCGIALAPLGVWLAHRVSNQWLSLLFAGVLAYVAYHMWQRSTQLLNTDQSAPACAVNPATSKLFWTAPCTKRLILTGGLAGFLSGLLGVGGGFVIVPTLRKVSNLDMKSIIATSLTAIAAVSATGVVSYMAHRAINWQVALPFALATIVGMLVGQRLKKRLFESHTQRIFAVFAGLVAIALAIKAISWIMRV